jgi:lysophospholipase L1-like esterase
MTTFIAKMGLHSLFILIVLGIISALLGIFIWFLVLVGILVVAILCLVVWYKRGGYFNRIRKKQLVANPFNENQDKDLMIGSSFFQDWTTAKQDFAPLDIVNIGIGGTIIKSWTDYLDNTVVPYAPRSLIVYVGSNDFNGKATAEGVFADLVVLFNAIAVKLPGVPVVYLGICPTLARKESWNEIQKFNDMAKATCEQRENFYYVDSAPSIFDANGELHSEIYKFDKLHFNKKGYQAWASGVCPRVRQILMK